MIEITITGYSDDCIEIEGDIREEWNWYAEDVEDRRLIAVSDGTLLSVMYDHEGIWRFNPVKLGTAEYAKREGIAADDTHDIITLKGDIQWVALAVNYGSQPKLEIPF